MAKDWLQRLDGNHIVVVQESGIYAKRYVREVERVTSTQILVNGERYSRETGVELCSSRKRKYLVEYTTQIGKEIQRDEICDTIRHFKDWEKLPLSLLKNIDKAIQSAGE